ASWTRQPLGAGRRAGVEFTHAHPDGVALQPGGGGHRGDAATAEYQRFGRGPQPTPPLVQKGTQDLELRSDGGNVVHPSSSAHPFIRSSNYLSAPNRRLVGMLQAVTPCSDASPNGHRR